MSEYKISKYRCSLCKHYEDYDSACDCNAPLDEEQIERFLWAKMGGEFPVCPCFEEVPDVD